MRQELEWRTARGAEDRSHIEASLKDLRDNLVPREEHTRVWINYDDRNKDLQRQIDELKQQSGSVYGQRNIILELHERLDRVERQRATHSG